MASDKISVIVPVYKVEEYLNFCVQSLIDQTYQDLEIILVDDGSPDNCPAMCDEWATKDKRIKVVHKQNGGLSSARNAGLEIATGKYVTFIDSDDTFHPQAVEILHNGMLKTKADVCLCSWQRCKDIAKPNNKNYDVDTLQYETIYGDDAFDVIFNKRYPLVMTAWAKMYKVDQIKKVGFSTDYIIHEDEYFIHHMLNEVNSLSFVDAKLYNNTIRNTSITGAKYTQKRLFLVKARQDRWNFCKQNKPQFEQKALNQYLMGIASGYTQYKQVKGDKEILLRLLKEFNLCYPQLKNKSFFVKLFKHCKPAYALALAIKEKLDK